MTNSGDLVPSSDVTGVNFVALSTDDENFPKLLDQIFREQGVRYRISTEEADELDQMDWVVLFKDQLDILRKSDDWQQIFNTLLQIRHYAQTALISHVRKSLDDLAA